MKTKKILLAVPKGMLEKIDAIAQIRHMTRSELLRECIRKCLEVNSGIDAAQWRETDLEQPSMCVLSEIPLAAANR